MIHWLLFFKDILTFLKEMCVEELLKLVLGISINVNSGNVGSMDRSNILKSFHKINELKTYILVAPTRDSSMSP